MSVVFEGWGGNRKNLQANLHKNLKITGGN